MEDDTLETFNTNYISVVILSIHMLKTGFKYQQCRYCYEGDSRSFGLYISVTLHGVTHQKSHEA